MTAGTPGQAAGIEVTHEPEIAVRFVQLWLCDLCLDGAGGECHVPGCALWINRAPDISLRGHPAITILDAEPQPAPELAAYEADIASLTDQRNRVSDTADQLRELLDEIGVMAANAPEDGDSFGVLEQIAMRIAAAGVPEAEADGEWPDPENPVTGRTPGDAGDALVDALVDERDGLRKALRAIKLGIVEPSPQSVAEDALNGRYFDPDTDAGAWNLKDRQGPGLGN